MARAALRWTVEELAARSALSKNTVTAVETERDTRQSTLDAIEKTLIDAGIEFIDGDAPGVRLHPKRTAKRGRK